MHPTALPLLPHEIDQLPLRERIHATLEAAEEAVFQAMDECQSASNIWPASASNTQPPFWL